MYSLKGYEMCVTDLGRWWPILYIEKVTNIRKNHQYNDSVAQWLNILAHIDCCKHRSVRNNRNLKFLESQREAPPIEYTDFGVER